MKCGYRATRVVCLWLPAQACCCVWSCLVTRVYSHANTRRCTCDRMPTGDCGDMRVITRTHVGHARRPWSCHSQRHPGPRATFRRETTPDGKDPRAAERTDELREDSDAQKGV